MSTELNQLTKSELASLLSLVLNILNIPLKFLFCVNIQELRIHSLAKSYLYFVLNSCMATSILLPLYSSLKFKKKHDLVFGHYFIFLLHSTDIIIVLSSTRLGRKNHVGHHELVGADRVYAARSRDYAFYLWSGTSY